MNTAKQKAKSEGQRKKTMNTDLTQSRKAAEPQRRAGSAVLVLMTFDWL